MLYCIHRLLCYFSDINVFYNNCMMYDILKDMLKEVCLEYYKKGYEDGVLNADIEKFNNELEVNFDVGKNAN